MYLVRSLVLSSLLALTACAGSPAASPQAEQEAKRFDPPAPDRGALYVYRSGLLGLARPVGVTVRAGTFAQLSYNSFIRVEGPAGPTEVVCRVGDRSGNAQIELQDGQTRFVEVSMKMGLLLPGCEVAEVPPEVGQTAIRSGRRLDPQ